MKRIARITRSGRVATALVGFVATVLTIVTHGPVVATGQQPTRSGGTTTDDAAVGSTSDHEGAPLFRKETFGGNGRTCETCHSRSTGTLSPQQVRERLQKDPQNPLSDGFIFDEVVDCCMPMTLGASAHGYLSQVQTFEPYSLDRIHRFTLVPQPYND